MRKSLFKTSVAGFLISLFIVTGCTKIDTTNLGVGLIPAVDNIHTFDTTLNIIANNFDNLPDCEVLNRADLNALGIITSDPYFGKSSAEIYMELKPSTFPVSIVEHDTGGLTVDSAVIVLQYFYSFGDTNTIQKAKVYPLITVFKVDSAYTSCNKFAYGSNLLGEKSFIPKRLKDSIFPLNEKAAFQLRIPIDKAIAEGWIQNASTELSSDSAFKIKNKGFAIVPDEATGGNAINYFDLSSANTRLSIYYRTTKGDKKDTTILNFPLTNTSGEANFLLRERESSEITEHLTHPVEGDKEIYIQTSPGSYAELKIPGLNNLSNRIIHRAELIVEQVYSTSTMDDIFGVPDMLYLDTKDTSTVGRYIPVPCDFNSDAIQSRFSTLGGHALKIKDGNGNMVNQYVFNISRYVQSIVTRKQNNAVFRLRAPYYIHNETPYVDRCNQGIALFDYGMNNFGDGRIKLNGTNGTPSAMKLRIIYSKLN